MVANNGRKLACELIENHFGEVVGKVCRCLTFRGQLSLPDIGRFCEMPVSQLRNSLLVLIQHNCVQGFKVEVEGFGAAAPKIFTSYLAIVENMLHRLRFPKFLVFVRDDLGEEAEALIEGLLEHGRLTLEQMTQRAAARSGKSEAEVGKIVKDIFAKLVRSQYIERCPTPEPILPPKIEIKKRSRTITVNAKLTDTEEQRIISAAAPMEAERFLLPALFADDTTIESMGDTASLGDIVGQKRKRDALQMDPKTEAAVMEKEVLWRINYEEFVRRLRHQACVSQVRSRIDVGAAIIFESMLSATRKGETTPRPSTSVPLSMETIMVAVRNTADGRTMTMERIRMALQMMSSESLGFIIKTSELGAQYVINFSKIIEFARRSEVESIVLQRFGKESCRIFRLLGMKGPLEQKQISDMALISLKETRDALYRLMKEEYLQLQEVAKAPDHAPAKTIYLWRVNHNAIEAHILNDMFQAASNLGQRLSYELQKEQEVLDLLKLYNQSRSSGHVTLTQNQHEQIKRVRKIASVLETSLMKLDDSILLFNDF